MTTKPFFYICLGLTLSLPLFYLDIAIVELLAKGRTVYLASPDFFPLEIHSEDVRANLRGKNAQAPPPSQMTPASGQHLLLDLQGGNFDKLNDEDYLRSATLSIIETANMHLLGIQSAKLNPQGVSVVAMLAESHLSIHTWPEHGSALVDLFTCGDGTKLHTLLDLVVTKFSGNLTASTYSIMPRGYKVDFHHAEKDPQFEPVEIMTVHKYKNKVVEEKSQYQNIAIYDHHDTAADDYSFDVVRSLFLDGVLQSSTMDENKYHESLVHPAFVASEKDPKRVLIVGGGEGGTLRETLKYTSVETATMVDLDAKVLELSRKHLPSYSNCTGFGTPSCFDDPRADVYTDDFFKWFDRNIGNDICESRNRKTDKLYDVIIVDLLDPETLPVGEAFSEYLYSEAFFRLISCSLSERGVLVSNFGEAPDDVIDKITGETDLERIAMFKDKYQKLRNLSKNFQNTRVYDIYIPSFRASWAFALGIVPRDPKTLPVSTELSRGAKSFDGSPPSVNRKIQERLIPGAPMYHFDGSFHHGFQYPTGDWKGVYCMIHPDACKDPLAHVSRMTSSERALWNPIVYSLRADLASEL